MPALTSFQTQLRGTLLVALSGTLFGLMGYLGTRLFGYHLSIENMLFWRFVIAALWIAMLDGLSGKTLFKKVNSDRSLMTIFILGALSYSGGSAFYFLASKHIGTGLAMVIFFSFPVFVMLFDWILGDWKWNKYAFFSLVAVVVGLLFLKGHGKTTLNMEGILFAVIAALSYGFYVYRSQHSTKKIDSRLLTFMVCAGNAIIFLCIALGMHTFEVPVHLSTWIYLFALGIVATALPIQLLLDGLKYISPVKASVLSVLEPIVTVLIGLALLHETISGVQFIGVLIVLLGAIVIQFERSSV